MRPGHPSDDAGGFVDPDTACGCDVEGPRGGAADDLDCVCRGAEGRLCDADDGEVECVRGIRAEAWTAVGVEGGVTIDDKEVEGSIEGQDRPDARKFPLKQCARFVRRYVRDVGQVLGSHHRKGEFAADDERSSRPAHVVVVDVYSTGGRCASERHGRGIAQLMPPARALSRVLVMRASMKLRTSSRSWPSSSASSASRSPRASSGDRRASPMSR